MMQAKFAWIMKRIRTHYLIYRNKCIMTAAEMTPMVAYDILVRRTFLYPVSVLALKKAPPTRDAVLFQVAVGSLITIIRTCTCYTRGKCLCYFTTNRWTSWFPLCPYILSGSSCNDNTKRNISTNEKEVL